MAAEVVGSAFLQPFVQIIFGKLASVVEKGYFSSDNVDELVKELKVTLISINHVLEEAEVKQYQKKHVKKWLDELKHVVYEADQLLDEISTDEMINKLKAESEPLTTNLLGLVSALTGNPFESRLNEQLDKLELLAKQKKELGLGEGPYASNEGLVSWKPSKRLSSTALMDESSIYGRDDDKDKLIKFLLAGNDSGNQVPIISIVGLGGMGKTTLAQLVYNDNIIKEHFELKAWVYVSESFDVVGLTKAILNSFKFQADGEDWNLLQLQLQDKLMGKKYLLVLDDIWNGDAECWEKLLRPLNHGSSGSKIIVTTRENNVAHHVLNSTKLFDLEQLEKNDCWSLFVKHAFQGKNMCEHQDLESIGRKIVDKCGGLPLAIKSLGQILRKKFSRDEWMQMLETDMWRISDEDHSINSVLRLSYHNLHSEIKRCFAYCSIFPKGYEFQKDELIKLWMAEGLLECCGSDKSQEKFGNEIFCYLESISFFQKSFDKIYGTYEPYVMHDLVNDLTKSVSGEFCIQIDDARVDRSLEKTRHIWCSLQSNCVDHTSLEPICELTGLRSLILEGNVILQGCMGVSISKNVQHDLFSGLKCLRMLTFSGCHLSELVDEISNLKLLRYLDLSYTGIKSLPDTICMLYNLQTLLLEGNALTDLPSNFSKLINLRHLVLPSDSADTIIKKMRKCFEKQNNPQLPNEISMQPKYVGELKNLQALPYFFVEKQKGYHIKELEKLNQIHGTIRIEGLGNVIDPADAVTANLKDKKYLEELYMKFDSGREETDESVESDDGREEIDESVESDDGREEIDESVVESNLVCVLEALQPNRNLKKLTISQYKGNIFPNWLRGCHLPNLASLELQDCGLCSLLPPLGMLPFLKKLSISDCDGIKIIGEEFHGNNSTNVPFLSLEVLKFEKMGNWEEWLCLEGFPLLKELYIIDCPELKSALPQHLPSLQKLKISDCKKLRASSIPKNDNIIELDIQRCYIVLENELPTSLKKLLLGKNRYTEFSVDQNLINFPFLEALELDWSRSVNCPSLDLRCYNSLSKLSITGWGSSSLPLSLHLFTKLHTLYLFNCPELESFPMGGLPSNLSVLGILNCPKLIGSREEWGLFQLNSLKELWVSNEFENVESFPEENLLPPTLHSLYVVKCSKLRIMNNKGFVHLKSLHRLYIADCPSLESLPEKEALPNSLYSLFIINCPIIKEKYEKEGGERWHTISHIPNVGIDNINQE